MTLRALSVLIALASPFLFPFPFTIVLILAVAAIEPAVGLAAGVLTDLLYGAPGATFIWATMFGALASLLGLFVQRFVKARIM